MLFLMEFSKSVIHVVVLSVSIYVGGLYLLPIVFAQDSSQIAEQEEFINDIEKEMRVLERIIANPKKYDADRIEVTQLELDELKTVLKRARDDLTKLRSKSPSTQRRKIKLNAEVKATDTESGNSKTATLRSPCADADKFQRPKTSNYRLPSETNLPPLSVKPAKDLLRMERMFVEHMVTCELRWTAKSAADWGADRELFARKLVEAEKKFAINFVRYTAEEEKLVDKAYKAKPVLRDLTRKAPKYFRVFQDLKDRVEDARKRYRYSDATSRFKVEDLVDIAMRARQKWWDADNRLNKLVGIEVRYLNEVSSRRLTRGFAKLKKYKPKPKFELHQKSAFINTGSKLVTELMGPEGMEILRTEDKRRRKAYRGK